MSTDDLTEALRIAGQCRGFADPSRNERAIIALADEVDRLRAEADRWKARSVTAGTDLDAARAALERVKDIVQNPPIVRTVPGGNPPGYAGPIHLYDIRDLSLDVLRALEGKPS